MPSYDDHPDGQLCPNPDCCHDLAFDHAGFWRCPACEQVFYAEESDSDYEDYNVYRAEDGLGSLWMGERPAVIPVARDLGPSWGTPTDDPEIYEPQYHEQIGPVVDENGIWNPDEEPELDDAS